MVRAAVVTGKKVVWSGCVLLLVAALVAPLLGQRAAPASGGDRALQTLLDRAPALEAGTYRVSRSDVEPVTAKGDELPVVVQADVQRGADGKIRVLAAIGADAKQAVQVRMRVIEKGANPRLVADATGAGGPGPVRLVHEFTLAPGEYELQAVAGHPAGGGAVAGLARTILIVPDVWHGDLAVTPVVLADEAAPAAEASRGPAGRARFVFGATALSPAASDRFPRSGAVNLGFRVYNWTAEEKNEKPDLTVEYVFYQQLTKHLAFFNKIKPQQLTAETLGQTFDPASGVVAAGVMVPLHAFPFGEFELRVRVTDNRAKRTVERRATFRVAP